MKPTIFLVILLAGVLALRSLAVPSQTYNAVDAPLLPELTSVAEADWIGSKPLTVADLQGRVVLVHIWTFECWNCYRSFPWLNALEQRLQDKDLAVLGIHTPEFEHEKDRANVAASITEFGLGHPVMLDNDFAYWNALGNRYWPAWYVVDRQGRIRGRFVGEVHRGDPTATRIEKLISELLMEPR